MASIADIGVPGQPLSTPPLTEWQAAVRDAITPLVPQLGTVTPKAGWVDFGGSYAGLWATKLGRLVTIEGMLKPTSDTAVSAGTNITIADVPAGFYPARYVSGTCIIGLSDFTPSTTRILVNIAGLIVITPAATGTITAADGSVAFALTYRSAA